MKSIKEMAELHEDETIYADESRDSMVEDDAISPMEAAFMQGYEEAA